MAGLKMRGRDDETEVGLADQIGKRKAVSLIAARDLCRQAEMAGDEHIGSTAVAMLLPAYRLMRVAYSSTRSRDLPFVNASRLSDINVVLWAFIGGSNPSGPAHGP